MLDPSMMSDLLLVTGEFKNFFSELNCPDLCNTAMFVMNVMKKYKLLKLPHPAQKTDERSNHFRDLGNTEFSKKRYDKALHYYNASLMTAPPQSRCLKLAFGNRSALFYEIHKYKACMADIDNCLSLGYPSELMPKLIKRKNGCISLQRRERSDEASTYSSWVNYLQRINKRNKTIPCASALVTIREDGSNETVVAADTINAGEVIVVETAFTAILRDSNFLICCYSCQRFTENLIPCDTCCFVLFCNEECKEKCWQEYHSIECQIMSVVMSMPPIFRLSLKTVLKARSSCSSWNDLMQMVGNVDSLEKIHIQCYDSEPYRHLCIPKKFEIISKHGCIFNFAMCTAIMINALSQIPSFIPHKPEHNELVIKFLAKQLMHHCLSGVPIIIISTITQPLNTDKLNGERGECNGMFPFVGKFGHSCNPNVTTVGLNNKVALVALTEIKKGTELVISYGNHFLESNIMNRRTELYDRYAFVCKCVCCLDNWTPSKDYELDELTQYQKDTLRRIDLKKMLFEIQSYEGAFRHYKTICTAMKAFYELPKSKYYNIFFKAQRDCLQIFQLVHNNQYIEGCSELHIAYKLSLLQL